MQNERRIIERIDNPLDTESSFRKTSVNPKVKIALVEKIAVLSDADRKFSAEMYAEFVAKAMKKNWIV